MPVQPAIAKEVRQLAHNLFIQGLNWDSIALKTGVRKETLYKWKTRHGWGVEQTAVQIASVRPGQVVTEHSPEVQQSIQRTVSALVAEQGERTRKALSGELASQVEVLSLKRPKNAKELAGKNGRAATLKSLAESAKTIHSWDANSARSLVQINVLGDAAIGGEL